MSRRTVSVTTITPTAFADSTALTSGTFPFLLQGGSSTQLNKVWEISLSGQAASSSSPCFMLLARDVTVAATISNGTGQTDASNDFAFAVLGAAPFTGNTTTTTAQRSGTAHLANLSLNAFGGVYFWRANRLEECYTTLGNTATQGEVSVSAFTGSTVGALGCHMIYETI